MVWQSRSLASSPRISIALATFNGARYLDEQLRSLENQSLPPDEVVVVDDSSSDESLDIVRAFARRTPFAVHVVRNPCNKGYRVTFEAALTATSGDIVFLCDQDDVWHQRKIETVAAAFKMRPAAALIIHDLRICTYDLRPVGKTKMQREREATGSTKMYVTGMATAVRRELLSVSLPFPNIDLPHDDWLHMLAAALDVREVLVKPLADFRRHTENVTKESVLNSPKQLSRLRFLLRLGGTDSTMSIHRRKWALDAVAQTLGERGGEMLENGLATPEKIQEAIARSIARAELVEQRLALRRLPRPARLHHISALVRNKGYQEFSNWRSALKDALSP